MPDPTPSRTARTKPLVKRLKKLCLIRRIFPDGWQEVTVLLDATLTQAVQEEREAIVQIVEKYESPEFALMENQHDKLRAVKHLEGLVATLRQRGHNA